MRSVLYITALIAATTLAASCGPSYQPSYPSYEAVVSQYVPQDKYVGVRIDDPSQQPAGPDCACPRVWYDDHWTYYYHGHWIYWHHDCWYYYPTFYVYYRHGLPYVYTYTGPVQSITKGPAIGGNAPGQAHNASPPWHGASADAPPSSPPPRTSSEASSPSSSSDGRSEKKGGR